MSRQPKTAIRRPLTERREPYLRVFLLSFFMMMLLVLPVMIYTGGYFVYYGDFNSQQLPFYYLAHDAVQNGNFGWNWQTDLGANFIGSYSFYLLGSPFFWLTVPFPQEWVLYLIPFLLALKHAVAALTAYAYIRRFVRSRQASTIGALLYAFSGFQLYNVFFNHFQDVTAFFPLLLLAMEQRVNENRRGVFGLTVALLGLINYYFFSCEAVFAVIYFIIRCTSKDFHADVRKFFGIAVEAVFGTMIACVILLPAALAVLDNYRVHKHLIGMDMVAYTDRTRVWRIIQSFFMIPDVPARPNLFRSDYGKWSSIAGYLPMFSMAGVIAFMSQKRKHWATKLVAVCMVCALVPILNSMFYTFNSSYYARWFYMPVLIMALMTAYAIDNPQIRWKGGIVTCIIVNVGFILISLLPRKENDEIKWFDFAAYPLFFWVTAVLTLLMLYFVILVAVSRGKSRKVYKLAIWATVFSCLCTGFCMMYFGIGLGADPTSYLNASYRAKDQISLDMPENQFARVDISKDHDNYPMFWGYSNMRCFHSIVPPSVMDFYDAVGVQRDVASRAETTEFPLRELFSVKYYIEKISGSDAEKEHDLTEDMPMFTLLKQEAGYRIYENEAYIPMGIAYDTYIDRAEFDKMTNLAKEKTMVKALVLSEEQRDAYSSILEPITGEEKYAMSDEEFIDYCKERAAETCESFRYDSKGFDAVINLEKPEMVFFSVPYEKGWSAKVNGRDVQVERVNVGFMAVRCEKGENSITFTYETPGLRVGMIVMLCGAAGLVLYLILMAILDKDTVPKYPKQKHYYDYNGLTVFTDHERYLNFAAYKQQASPRRRRRPAEEGERPRRQHPAEEPEYAPETAPPAPDDPAADDADFAEPADAEYPPEPDYPDPFAEPASGGEEEHYDN